MEIKPLNILFLTCRFPFPLIGGDRIKPYHLLRYLSKHHSVTLVCLYQGLDTTIKEYTKEIESFGITVVPIRLSLFSSFVSILTSFFRKIPLEVLYYTQPSFKKKVDSLLDSSTYDLAIAFFLRTAEYIRKKNIKKILIAEDCRLVYQQRSVESSTSMLQKAIRIWETNKLAYYEKDVVNDFDCTTFVTNEDILFVKNQNPNAKYALLSNGFDTKKFTFIPFSSIRKNALFVGKLDVWANEMMVRYIVETIMPKIRQHFPSFSVTIVGGNPKKSLLSYLEQFPFVTVHSNVSDVVPYLHSHFVFLHPHRGATGIQNKIIEAMATGIPIVTTNSGVQGIAVQHKEHILISASVETMSDDILDLLQNPSQAELMVLSARSAIENEHKWESIFTSFETIIISVLQ